MEPHKRNRLFSLLSGGFGALVGYFYPLLVQGYLPLIGLAIGLLYFSGSHSANQKPQQKKVTDFSSYTWDFILKILMGFLIGAALTSSLRLTMVYLEQ
jgi:uncharacterized membrane protein YfcA